MSISKSKTALTFGFLIAFMHLLWSVLVALGIAQMFMNFVLNLHMITMPIVIMPFNLMKALELIIMTFVVGYIFGWFMAYFWNKCFKQKSM
ncbi:MAG: hypothetical protein WC264_01900 [Candidatus Paceibacterota bacterium]